MNLQGGQVKSSDHRDRPFPPSHNNNKNPKSWTSSTIQQQNRCASSIHLNYWATIHPEKYFSFQYFSSSSSSQRWAQEEEEEEEKYNNKLLHKKKTYLSSRAQAVLEGGMSEGFSQSSGADRVGSSHLSMGLASLLLLQGFFFPLFLSVACHLFLFIPGPTSYSKLFRGFVISLLLFWCLLRASSRLFDLSVPPFRVVLTRFPTEESDLVNSFVDVVVVVVDVVVVVAGVCGCWCMLMSERHYSPSCSPFINHSAYNLQAPIGICFVSFPNYHHLLLS